MTFITAGEGQGFLMLWEQYKYGAIAVKSVSAHGWQITWLAVGRREPTKAQGTLLVKQPCPPA